MKLLLIIDVQKSFINNNTEMIIPKISELVDNNKFDKIIFTRFTNSYDSIYFKKLSYNGCITEDDKKIMIETKDNIIIEKQIYSAVNEEFKKYIKDNNITKIYVCGIDTECCVLKTVFDLFENEYDVYVLKDYCACTHGIERHNNALEILRRNIGKDKII